MYHRGALSAPPVTYPSVSSARYEKAANALGQLLIDQIQQSTDYVEMMASSMLRMEIYLLAIVVLCYFLVFVALVLLLTRTCANYGVHNGQQNGQSNKPPNLTPKAWWKWFEGDSQVSLACEVTQSEEQEFFDVRNRPGVPPRRPDATGRSASIMPRASTAVGKMAFHEQQPSRSGLSASRSNTSALFSGVHATSVVGDRSVSPTTTVTNVASTTTTTVADRQIPQQHPNALLAMANSKSQSRLGSKSRDRTTVAAASSAASLPQAWRDRQERLQMQQQLMIDTEAIRHEIEPSYKHDKTGAQII